MMSLFPIPGIKKKINKLRRVFLWQGNKEKLGGFGDSVLNLALWRRFISRKYGLQNNWITDEVTCAFGCSVWKTIRKLWPSFASNMSFKIGDGVKTYFWNEIWIRDRNLKTLFQDLFILSLQQMATVAHVSQKGVIEGHDSPIWKLHNKGSFTVKSCYLATGI
ncbi:hypothetical protein H5410_045113 [Solanum commersonii]|uniref:Reverse transcriptase zinc-binding domain-containing protein n=1 Tax=Solanum commersonii TaxID=4109 RepID=A0A9J5XAK9_SOLCO|nr:hypothetical protein H5410_045113 [Solanum commersonii]